MKKMTYLIVTNSVMVHRTSDTTPSTACSVAVVPRECAKASRRAYSGLVPMSPKTTPIEPKAMARKP